MTINHEESGVFDLLVRLKALNAIGVALSAEKNGTRLLELILEEAKRLTFADGGVLYLRTEDNQLKCQILIIDTVDIHLGGTSGQKISYMPLPLYDKKGVPNLHLLPVCSAIQGKTIRISNAYVNTEYNFSNTREFDRKHHYLSRSFLAVPMKDYEGEVIGVLQLINALDPITGEFGAFDSFEQELAESLASQAAVALVNQKLLEDQKRLFESLIKLIATAIDQKSPYTGGHCLRVPELTLMLADATARVKVGPLKDFNMTEEERYELEIAGLLHDCGKITTPEHIIDKSSKLETIFDRIQLIDTRFEILKRDAEIIRLRKQLVLQELGEKLDFDKIDEELTDEIQLLHEERELIRRCNRGAEFMPEEQKQRIKKIAERRWVNFEGKEVNFLTEDEIKNLTITKGTLTEEERQVINHHIVTTINMLQSLHYPKSLKRVPEFAGGHHERMDGKGYPKGLTREQMSIQARAMGIADIFEALTAQDRPYKKPMPISQALTILGHLKLENHIDPDLFNIFVHEKVYLNYARLFLKPEQIDEVDHSKIPGYTWPE